MNPRGLKFWSSNANLLDEAERLIDMGIFHYIELMPLPDGHIHPFNTGTGIPYIIHWTHEQYGTNLGDRAKHVLTREMLYRAFDWADALRAKLIVVHPGYGDIMATIEILDDFLDQRLCVENMPYYVPGDPGIVTDKVMLGYNREEMEQILHPRGLKFCLDFGHAAKSAIPRGLDYKVLIADMAERIPPSLFHLSDGTLGAYDDHLSLGEGSLDIGYFKEVIMDNPGVPVTFETTKVPGTLSEDVKNAIYYLETEYGER